MKSTTRPEVPGLEVLVHRFSWCSCGSESHSANHIKLETFKRPVKPGQAVALSYGIGDFDRQKHLFGHVDGLESELVRLEFGGEWDIERLTGALVALSGKHGAVWLDQLSIPQDPASITLHLQNMPQIYCGFAIVVLLPNGPCRCLQDAFNSWNAEVLQDLRHPAGPQGSPALEDFDIRRITSKCFNAFPVSSYHFRLWTKQEFSYARKISAQHCGVPGRCLRGIPYLSPERLETLIERPDHLSRWISWKYASYTDMASNQSEYVKAMRYSTVMAAQDDGEDHLTFAVVSFLVRKTPYDTPTPLRLGAHVARFVLGSTLSRDPHDLENMFSPLDMHSSHVATSQKDFALAVLPAADGYRLPQGHAEMTLPELIDNGIEQYQSHYDNCFKTKLPRGLFEDGIGSMGPKPCLHLRTENIRCVGDVYGSILATHFPTIHKPSVRSVTLLYLIEEPPRPSRLTLSKTYAEAFGSASTAEVCDFMRKLPWKSPPESGVRAYREWEIAIYRGEIAAPVDGWPSPAHEQAMLEASMRREAAWWDPSWPEIDHERACYNFMCDHVCIHPDVAREKGLGLVVKTSDPPCIGFVNGVVYDKMRATEQFQQHHGFPAPALWRRNNGIVPEDWLTLTVSEPTSDLYHQTLEVVKADTRRGLPEHVVDNIGPGYKESVPRYMVRGVWFYCLSDDECIGALLPDDFAEDYDAILV
jgi:hypothetical protein